MEEEVILIKKKDKRKLLIKKRLKTILNLLINLLLLVLVIYKVYKYEICLLFIFLLVFIFINIEFIKNRILNFIDNTYKKINFKSKKLKRFNIKLTIKILYIITGIILITNTLLYVNYYGKWTSKKYEVKITNKYFYINNEKFRYKTKKTKLTTVITLENNRVFYFYHETNSMSVLLYENIDNKEYIYLTSKNKNIFYNYPY